MRIALFLPHLGLGGVERTTLNLAGGFAGSGCRTDVVVGRADGPLAAEVPDEVDLVDLRVRSTVRAIPGLASYLRQARPSVLISSKTHANVVAIGARLLARSGAFHIIRECSKYQFEDGGGRRERIYLTLASRLYGRADAIVAVSRDVAQACSRHARIDVSRIATIPDPIVTPTLRRRIDEPVDHPLLDRGSPIFVGVGRLVPEKDFDNLLHAFELVRRKLPGAVLIILGEGPERPRLERTIQQLDLSMSVSLPGFVVNPLPYMRRAAAFVLSSRSEGFPGVVVESLFAGCPVAATRCSDGVADVLDDGALGPLVRIGDHKALAGAMLDLVTRPPDSRRLRERAEHYDVSSVVRRFQELFPAGNAS